MQIPFGKISLFVTLGLWTANAQEIQPAAEGVGKPAVEAHAPGSNPKNSPNTASGSDTSAALDYLFNRKPQDGSIGKQAVDANRRADAKMIAADAVDGPRLGDEGFRSRFERYLGTAEVSQSALEEYFAQMKQISALLRENQPFEAWKKLHELSEDPLIDAGVSRELANRVEAIWITGRVTTDIDKTIDRIRKDVKTANANADLMSERITEKEIELQRKLGQGQKRAPNQTSAPNGGVPAAGEGNTPPPNMVGIQGKLQLTEEYLRSLELKAKIKFNELRQQQLLEQAKADFSEYISTLFNSGRLNHVVLAADFYRKLFQEGQYPAAMAQQVNASLEINRDVATTVDVFRYKVKRGQLSAATDSLQNAFATSELNPAVLGLERSLKEQIGDFLASLDQMRNLIEVRDFGKLEGLLAQIQRSATDFDTTKPLALVNAVKLESKMRLGKAKLAAQQGDTKLAMEEFQAAAEAWPGNPDLEDKALTFFNTQDIKSQSLMEFDRLVQDHNFRAIFEKQLAFAPAIAGDAKREEALKNALESIKNAEMASEKANVMMMNGDVFGAWETIELASINLPDDRKLNKLRADLSGRSAEFVAAVNKARDAEGRNELGYSLTWYVNAQRQYPASQIANQGIDRLSKKLLEPKL